MRQPIERRVLPRTFHQGGAAFDPQHLARAGGDRQGEVTQPAKPIDDALVGLRIQPPQGAGHQHAVDLVIHLREIGRLERHRDAEFGQGVAQARPRFIEQPDRVRPLGLQPPLHGVRGGKLPQAAQIGVTHRLQVAQHQGRDAIAHGHLDLRQAVALFHGADQFAQRQQQVAQMAWQHLATVHIGHVARLALVKPDQHLALLDDETHRQPGSETVTPGRPLNRPQQHFRLHLAQVPQRVFEGALFGGDLCADVEVLHLAAATGAEMRALRQHPLRTLASQRRH